VKGDEMEEYHVCDAKMELTFSKGIEMFAESIPGSILQTYAALNMLQRGAKPPDAAVISIISSALTTGFTSASIR
jgi:hypothetical protein